MKHGLTWLRGQLFGFLTLGAACGLVASCKSDVCDAELVTRAQSFLEAHQACETDADCAVVSDYCGTLPNGYCGQLIMNKAGESSAEWRDISTALEDCSPADCAVCLAVRAVGCSNGSCGGP